MNKIIFTNVLIALTHFLDGVKTECSQDYINDIKEYCAERNNVCPQERDLVDNDINKVPKNADTMGYLLCCGIKLRTFHDCEGFDVDRIEELFGQEVARYFNECVTERGCLSAAELVFNVSRCILQKKQAKGHDCNCGSSGDSSGCGSSCDCGCGSNGGSNGDSSGVSNGVSNAGSNSSSNGGSSGDSSAGSTGGSTDSTTGGSSGSLLNLNGLHLG